MEAEKFKNIIEVMDLRLEVCIRYLDKAIKSGNVVNYTLKELADAIEFSKLEYVKQSEILMVDLYHILGMGDLDAVQTAVFISKIRQYEAYRPIINKLKDIKTIDILNLPKFNAATYYNTKQFSLRLNKSGNCQNSNIEEEDVANRDDYVAAKSIQFTVSDENDLNSEEDDLSIVAFKNNNLIFKKEQALSVAKLLIKKVPAFKGYTAGNLTQAMVSVGAKFGIIWCGSDENNICRGVVKSNSLLNAIKANL